MFFSPSSPPSVAEEKIIQRSYGLDPSKSRNRDTIIILNCFRFEELNLRVSIAVVRERLNFEINYSSFQLSYIDIIIIIIIIIATY